MDTDMTAQQVVKPARAQFMSSRKIEVTMMHFQAIARLYGHQMDMVLHPHVGVTLLVEII